MRSRHLFFSSDLPVAIRPIVSKMRQAARMLPGTEPATFELPPARRR
jgi:hypothetical protein